MDTLREPIPPTNLDAEQSVLGSMMIGDQPLPDGGYINEPARIAMGELDATDFYRPAHQEVYSAICALVDRREPTDLITLQEELRTRGKLSDCGGVEYLMALVDTVPTAANVGYYVKIVQRYSQLRKQQAIALELQDRLAGDSEADPTKIADWLHNRLDSLQLNRGTGLVKAADVMMPHLERMTTDMRHEGMRGYTSGFSHIDARTGGFGQPMYILLRADRGQGKTHLLIQTSVNCLRSGRAAVVVSMDTPKHILLNRYIAHLSGIDNFRLMKPRENDWKAISDAQAWLWNQPLYFWWEENVTCGQLFRMVQGLQSSGVEVGLIGIDYAELLGYKQQANHEQEIAEIAKGMKKLRDEIGTTVMLLTQVNADGKERWSKALGNLADVVCTWKKDDAEHSGSGVGKFIAEKNRFGAGWCFDCRYDFSTSRIREVSPDDSDPAFPPIKPWWLREEQDEL